MKKINISNILTTWFLSRIKKKNAENYLIKNGEYALERSQLP